MGSSLTFQWLFKLLCLQLYDLDTDWYLLLIIIMAVDNQMIKFGKMSLRFLLYFVFASSYSMMAILFLGVVHFRVVQFGGTRVDTSPAVCHKNITSF